MLNIANKDSVVKVAISRRMSTLEHQAGARKANEKAVKQAANTMRKAHGSN